MIDWKKLMQEPKILFAIGVTVLSLIAIQPHLTKADDGTYSLATDIKKGLDLQGGVRSLVYPADQTPEVVRKTADVLSSRISAFGLQEAIIRTVSVGEETFIEIALAGSTEEQLQRIIEQQGKFEAKVDRKVELVDEKGVLLVNDKSHQISLQDNIISIDGQTLEENGTVMLEGVPFAIINRSHTSSTFLATVLTGADVTQVFKDPQHAVVGGSGNQWGFEFAISINQEAAKRFEKAVMNSPIQGGSLESRLHLILDEKEVDVLTISAGLQRGAQTQISIQGGATTKEEALENMKQLQSILASGALPTTIEVKQLSTVSPTLGQEFMKLSLAAIFGAVIAVSVIIFIRYKDPVLVIPIILTSALEIVIIFGVSAVINWTIDLASIAGIIAAIGTGVDNQIVIADETYRREEKEALSTRGRIKAAFFIIFVAAGTTGAAMIPLMIIGAGAVKGFALTTLIGVAAGVFITRPAFAKIVEYIR